MYLSAFLFKAEAKFLSAYILPRFGVRMHVRGGYGRLSYYGRGPWKIIATATVPPF
jgi:hypothetical protein